MRTPPEQTRAALAGLRGPRAGVLAAEIEHVVAWPGMALYAKKRAAV